jgi:hypothetical protein
MGLMLDEAIIRMGSALIGYLSVGYGVDAAKLLLFVPEQEQADTFPHFYKLEVLKSLALNIID